jgi:hypothetical protein
VTNQDTDVYEDDFLPEENTPRKNEVKSVVQAAHGIQLPAEEDIPEQIGVKPATLTFRHTAVAPAAAGIKVPVTPATSQRAAVVGHNHNDDIETHNITVGFQAQPPPGPSVEAWSAAVPNGTVGGRTIQTRPIVTAEPVQVNGVRGRISEATGGRATRNSTRAATVTSYYKAASSKSLKTPESLKERALKQEKRLDEEAEAKAAAKAAAQAQQATPSPGRRRRRGTK